MTTEQREEALRLAKEAGFDDNIIDFDHMGDTDIDCIVRLIALARASAAPQEPVCDNCNGSGSTLVMTYGRGPDDYEQEIQCPSCGGTGASPVVAAPQGAQPVAYWLIERDASSGTHCEWWVRGMPEEWATDSSLAQRFNEVGAQQHIVDLKRWGVKGNLRATEHIDCDGPDLSYPIAQTADARIAELEAMLAARPVVDAVPAAEPIGYVDTAVLANCIAGKSIDGKFYRPHFHPAGGVDDTTGLTPLYASPQPQAAPQEPVALRDLGKEHFDKLRREANYAAKRHDAAMKLFTEASAIHGDDLADPRTIENLREVLAARPLVAVPAAEPYAWAIDCYGPVEVFLNKQAAELSCATRERHHHEPARKVIPLYASPAVAAPQEPTDADKRDAARYRWLRKQGDLQRTVLDQIQALTEGAMDRCIDAAIRAAEGEKP